MNQSNQHFGTFDTAIIGGGFFGCSLALAFAAAGERVVVVEKGEDLLTRASYVNQARVHNGYHYPRSFLTAARSAINYPRFLVDFDDCIDRSFTQVYGIARGGSKVSPYQYRRFCQTIGIPLKPVPDRIARLFDPDRIEEVFCTEECAFDAVRLRARLKAMIEERGVTVLTGLEIDRVTGEGKQEMVLHATGGGTVEAKQVFNCVYSEINRLLGRSGMPLLPLKHEVAEMAMIEVPASLRDTGITIMDGPYFSLMPFPALGLHSLSHVTYTPHESWTDTSHPNRAQPEARLSRSIFMQRDAQRYMPVLSGARHVRSLFETKTVLLRNEVDDGRPILCRQNYGLKNFHVILGAKIDNIYDVLKMLGREPCFAG